MDYAELKDLQSLPLKYKVMITKQRIQEWYEHWEGKVYVSFSGGKDSTVLLHLVRELYPEVEAVFVDTGLEFPEIREFVKSTPNVIWLKPKMTFKEVLQKHGYPVISKEIALTIEYAKKHRQWAIKRLNGEHSFGNHQKYKFLLKAPFKISSDCCNVMKKTPFKEYEKQTKLNPIVGTMASEGGQRESAYKKTGCNSFESKRPISNPLGFWREQDIWEYLHTYNVLYCSVYDMGYTRTGCMFCMFGVHLEPEPNRFQKMQVTHPKQWDYCMYNLGLKEVLEYIGVPYNNDNEGLWTTKDLIEMEC